MSEPRCRATSWASCASAYKRDGDRFVIQHTRGVVTVGMGDTVLLPALRVAQ